MKKFTLLSAAFLALAMTACNDDPIGVKNPAAPGGDISGKYIAIKFNNTNSSRALGDDEIGYVNGTSDENKLDPSQIHFLFFDVEGEPFTMRGRVNGTIGTDNAGNATNWIKPVNIDSEATDDNTNASAANSVLILGDPDKGVYSGAMPSRIICVANVDDETIKAKYVNKSIKQLMDYSTSANSPAPLHKEFKNEKGNYIMTSATYWEGSDIICWTDIESSNICASQEMAYANPVQIYIERLCSKVNVQSYPNDPRVKTTVGENMVINYYYVDDDNQIRRSEDKIIMMEPVGWTVNNQTKQVFGIKHLLKADGTSDYFDDWRDFNRNGRSFWATTTSRREKDNFLPIAVTNAVNEPDYVLPNTRDCFLQGEGSGKDTGVNRLRGRVNFARSFATKILFVNKIHIVEPTATEYTPGDGDQLMQWGGNFYTPEALCRVLEDNNPGKRVAFSRVEDVSNGDGHFMVNFFALGDGMKDFSGRDLTDPTTGKMIDGADADALSDVPTAQYWNGMAYYIVNISNKIYCTKSSSPNRGKEMYGLVRNTSYVYDFEKYIGMGTPIPAPEADTRVENPSESDSYVAAKLNILNWRLVSYNLPLQ